MESTQPVSSNLSSEKEAIASENSRQDANASSEAQSANESESTSKSNCCTKDKVLAWLLKWHLPLMLISGLILGYVWPLPGDTLNNVDLGGICFPSPEVCVYNSIGNLFITLIFLMSGMKLKTEEIKKALKTWKAALYGIVSILFITPCITFALIRIDFGIPEFAVGLALFFSQATTLSSGPIITGQAKGNIALALLLTVVTNILGVFTMPLFVSSSLDYYIEHTAEADSNNQTSGEVDIKVDPVPIILKLIFAILVPLAVGKSLRYFARVQQFTKDYKKSMKLLSSFLLAAIVWMKVSSSAEDLDSLDALSIFIVFFTGIVVHIIFLLFNFSFTHFLMKLPQREKRATVIVTSQKTLPVAITVLEFLPESAIGSPGLVAVPIIAAHFVQIVMDAFLAAQWAAIPLENENEDAGSVHSIQEVETKQYGSELNGSIQQV